jgi:hypothetical protein
MTIPGPIAISNPSVRLVTPSQGPTDFSDKLQPPLKIAELNQNQKVSREQWEKQINTSQNTVIELKGEIIATFGDNGFQTFFKNSDGRLVEPGSSQSEVLTALKNKYGAALNINTFLTGKGPAEADIFEQKHGYRPQPPINTRA